MARPLLALSLALALLALSSPAANAARPLDLPANASVLFSLTADGGTLTPAKGKDRFVLTLRKIDRRAVWFTDRPARRTGALGAGALFGAWARLGFTKDAPNAVLTILSGRRTADTVAIELGTPRYDAKARAVTFPARALPGATGGLAHLRSKVDDRVPRRFGEAALFIDDAIWDAGTVCTMGSASLFAGVRLPSSMAPANGATLPIAPNQALYAILDDTFGAGPLTFLLPRLTAPPQMAYAICTLGLFPERFPDDDEAGACTIGQIAFAPTGWAGPGRLPADGRQVPVSSYEPLASLIATDPQTITLPNVPSPLPGLAAYICTVGLFPTAAAPSDDCWIGEVQLFASGRAMPGNFTPADGRLLTFDVSGTSYWNMVLYSVMGVRFGGDGRSTFGLPNLPGPVPGTSYGVCSVGAYPTGTFVS